eukprot:scaffold45633_cov85-Phaeocystis_antarctica.AAC.3
MLSGRGWPAHGHSGCVIEINLRLKPTSRAPLIERRVRSRHVGQSDPYHRVSRDERRELRLAPPLRVAGTLRQHDVAAVGRAVVHAHRRRLWQCGAKLSEERARRAHATRAVLDILVPAGRESEDGERVARAQGAHHEVVRDGLVGHDNQLGRRGGVGGVHPHVLRECALRVLEQRASEVRVHPRACHESRPERGGPARVLGRCQLLHLRDGRLEIDSWVSRATRPARYTKPLYLPLSISIYLYLSICSHLQSRRIEVAVTRQCRHERLTQPLAWRLCRARLDGSPLHLVAGAMLVPVLVCMLVLVPVLLPMPVIVLVRMAVRMAELIGVGCRLIGLLLLVALRGGVQRGQRGGRRIGLHELPCVGRLEPGAIHLDVDRAHRHRARHHRACRACRLLTAPAECSVREADAIQRLLRSAPAEGGKLGVGEDSDETLDHSHRAEDVPRAAQVRPPPPRRARSVVQHPYRIARCEARRHVVPVSPQGVVQLSLGEEPTLQRDRGDRRRPLVVVAPRVVPLLVELLNAAAKLVHRDLLGRGQLHEQCVRTALPEGERRPAADVKRTLE